MKFLTLAPIVIYITLLSDPVWARSLRATADKLGQEVSMIGFALGLLGLALGGIYLVLGKQDAGPKVTQVILGILVLSSARSVVKLIQSAA
jgi:hypothetical protein